MKHISIFLKHLFQFMIIFSTDKNQKSSQSLNNERIAKSSKRKQKPYEISEKEN